MKNSFNFAKVLLIAFITLSVASCHNGINIGSGIKGSGNVIEQQRTIAEDFKNIAVSHGIKLILEQSDNKSVTVSVDDNLQKHIITRVENGTLIIKADESYNSTSTPKVTVRMPVINGLTSTSGSSIESVNTLITDKLDVTSESGSEINLHIEADNLTLESSSGSSIKAIGKALKLETTSSSGSEIEADKLMANEVISQSNSGSSTSVSPILSLKATASSGASIGYHKIPKNLSKEENSGGSVSEE